MSEGKDKTVEQMREALSLDEKSAEASQKKLDILREQRDVYESIVGETGRNYLASLAKEEEYLRLKTERLKTEDNIRKQLAEMSDEELGTLGNINDLRNASIQQLQQLLASHSSTDNILVNMLNTHKQIEDSEENQKKHMEDFNKQVSKADSLMAKLGTKSGLFTVNLNKMAQEIGEMGGEGGTIEAMYNAFRDQFNTANLFASLSSTIMASTLNLVIAADKATAGFAAATAVGRT